MDAKTPEFLRGYGSAASDLARLGFPVQAVRLLESAGLRYRDLKAAGLSADDLRRISECQLVVAPDGAKAPKKAVRL